ncbi:hypothetical protein [Pedobacter frigiditerrae]|uniref:hypothetical protein n=1 Tax=Pedobacter frigiditerrae TaxID=2530452 RepID=UPI00292CC712|nr:hypothetical protein [Pedobacter frigiditerrae]
MKKSTQAVFKKGFSKLTIYILLTLFIVACQQKKNTEHTESKLNAWKLLSKSGKLKKTDTLIFADPQLAKIVKGTEDLFTTYDTINLSKNYSINQLKLNRKLIDELKTIEKDSVDGFEITAILSNHILSNIERILNWKNVSQYDLSLLLKNHLITAKSPDNKLYSFSFDERTGGTYRSMLSIIYYNIDKGEQKFKPLFVSKEQGDDVFNPDGYGTIDTLHTKQGVKYLLIGSVVGCTTCIGSYVDFVHYNNGKFIKDFNYSVGTRSNNTNIPNSDYDDETSVINYDKKLRRINIYHIIPVI